MWSKIIAAVIAFGLGYLFFWGIAFKVWSANRLGPNMIGKKYMGLRSYSELRSCVLGANALGAPIVAMLSIFFFVRLGWPDAIWVCAFIFGYILSFWRFLKKPRSAWED